MAISAFMIQEILCCPDFFTLRFSYDKGSKYTETLEIYYNHGFLPLDWHFFKKRMPCERLTFSVIRSLPHYIPD
jgi:hypothetical protein